MNFKIHKDAMETFLDNINSNSNMVNAVTQISNKIRSI